MIVTRHGITVGIDDESFDIVVADPTARQQKEFNALIDGNKRLVEDINEHRREIKERREMIDINVQILRDGTLKEKALTWLEHKRFVQETQDIETALTAKTKELETLDANFATLYKKRFDETVTGTGKEALRAKIDALDIPYSVVMDEISKLRMQAVAGK